MPQPDQIYILVLQTLLRTISALLKETPMNVRRLIISSVVVGVLSISAFLLYFWPRFIVESDAGAIHNLRGISQSASKKTPRMVEEPGVASKAAGDSVTGSSDEEGGYYAYQTYAAQVRELLYQERFELLDSTAAGLRLGRSRFRGGAWKLHKFYIGLEEPADGKKATEAEWQHQLSEIRKWTERYPDSITACVGLGAALVNYAWKARGTGFADTVSDGGWRLFRERLAQAERVLNEARRLKTRCPHWYAIMQNVATGQGWDAGRYDQLFEEGIAAEPLYHYLYSNKAQYLLPRWRGAPGDWERFAEEVRVRGGGKNGSILYYIIASDLSGYYKGRAFFAESDVSWAKMKQGFADRDDVYGANNQDLNEMSRLAGWAGDPEASRKFFERIGDDWDSHTWGEKKYFDEFKAWAFKASPTAGRR